MKSWLYPTSSRSIIRHVLFKRLIFRSRGDAAYGHVSHQDHFVVVATGAIEVHSEGGMARFAAPHLLFVPRGIPHQFFACADHTQLVCIWELPPEGTPVDYAPVLRPSDHSDPKEPMMLIHGPPDDLYDQASVQPLQALDSPATGVLQGQKNGLSVRLIPLMRPGEMTVLSTKSPDSVIFLCAGRIRWNFAKEDPTDGEAPYSVVPAPGSKMKLTALDEPAVLIEVSRQSRSGRFWWPRRLTKVPDQMLPICTVRGASRQQSAGNAYHRAQLAEIHGALARPELTTPSSRLICSEAEQREIVTWANTNWSRLRIIGPCRLGGALQYYTDLPPAVWEIKRRLVEAEGLADAKEDSFFYDLICYVMDGGLIHPHSDPNPSPLIHVRYNVFLQHPDVGGMPIYGGKKYYPAERSYLLCRAGLDLHMSERVYGPKARISLSFGFQVPHERLGIESFEEAMRLSRTAHEAARAMRENYSPR